MQVHYLISTRRCPATQIARFGSGGQEGDSEGARHTTNQTQPSSTFLHLANGAGLEFRFHVPSIVTLVIRYFILQSLLSIRHFQ